MQTFLNQALTFGLLISVPVFTFIFVAVPQGWPEKSFFLHFSNSQKTLVVSVISFSYLLPIFISCFVYILIYYSVIVNGVNKVGIVDKKTSSVYEDIHIGSVHNNVSISHSSYKQFYRQN
jgi:cellulose synthase/poly-beta-1,6-N-acetylglucosamine synthase-like glycosyltransferase